MHFRLHSNLRSSQYQSLFGLSGIAVLLLVAGCSGPLNSTDDTSQNARPAAKPVPSVTTPPSAPEIVSDTAAIRDAVNSTIRRHRSSFPKGTQVDGLTVKSGVAALDFNAAFNKLGNMGDTTEAHAQKFLRAALAQYPEIDKMTVTVEGRPYDSQATDWTTPFPVRETSEERAAEQSRADDTQDPLPSDPPRSHRSSRGASSTTHEDPQ